MKQISFIHAHSASLAGRRRTTVLPAILSVLITVSLFIFPSCDDYLNIKPDEDLSIEEVFADRAYTDAFLSNIYSMLQDEMEMNLYAGASDEMEIAYGPHPSHLLSSGAWNPSTGIVGDYWNHYYNAIRKCNIFLANADNVPTGSDEIRHWKGEAHFLRAFFYFQLIRLYGPVILIDKPLSTSENFLSFTRSPLTACVEFIVRDCDAARSMLPYRVKSDTDIGRANAIAAYALKSRALLYIASDWWNGNPDYAHLTNAKGESLFPEKNNARWQEAADAAWECIRVATQESDYDLYRQHADPVANYQQIFLDGTTGNRECIFIRNVHLSEHFDNCCDPVSLGGYSIMNPTQELVDAYQMANGSTPITGYDVINETTNELTPRINTASGYKDDSFTGVAHPNGYHPSRIRNMYVGREPRFYASINFCLQAWKGTTLLLYYEGKDGKAHAGSDYCKTGYIQKKLVDPEARKTPPRRNLRFRVFIRLGEIYLNYAEALNEAQGPVAGVYTYLNLIRTRAGLTGGLEAGLSQEQMRDRIRHERRIELAFEGHRFFDVRRWKIAGQTDNSWIHGMEIYGGSSATDNAFYRRTGVEKRIFVSPKHYFFPIPQSEINKNRTGISQNPGWTNAESSATE
jgi:hypothetical protein